MNAPDNSLNTIAEGFLPVLLDAALKGGVLLILAVLAMMMLRRASAATRHLVWRGATGVLVAGPLLSMVLPQWRVLPVWSAAVVKATTTEVSVPVSPAARAQGDRRAVPVPVVAQGNPVRVIPVPNETRPATQSPETVSSARPDKPAEPPGREVLSTAPASGSAPQPPAVARSWRFWIPVLWAGGFLILTIRLMAAHWFLRLAVRRCRRAVSPGDDRVLAALADACGQLAVRRRVTLLMDETRALPVTWGVFRPRVLLPLESREWSAEELRAVLLHEVAHIRRGDAVAKWLTQVACALHWFNPLVWWAAGRMHAECERACDDRVLAGGVRASAYARHLLHVATEYSPAAGTAVCGLAMARKSSIENRVRAVLSEKLNRRSVTAGEVAAFTALCAGVMVPLAMLQAADAAVVSVVEAGGPQPEHPFAQALFKEWKTRARKDGRIPNVYTRQAVALMRNMIRQGGWDKGMIEKLMHLEAKLDVAVHWTQEKTIAVLDELTAINPGVAKDALETLGRSDGQAARVLAFWQQNARTDGKITGALIGRLKKELEKEFYSTNRDVEEREVMNPLLSRLDAKHDWIPAEALVLLREAAAIPSSRNAVGMAEMERMIYRHYRVRNGSPLPPDLTNAAWGKPRDNGLRCAWLPETPATEYPLGSRMDTRLLLHNSSNDPLPVWTQFFHQFDSFTGRNTAGGDIKVEHGWSTGPLDGGIFVLKPGEYCEVEGMPVTSIDAKAGEEVAVTIDVEDAPFDKEWRWWREIVQERVEREGPMPASVADRAQLIHRVVLDLTGGPPAEAEVSQFTGSASPHALKELSAALLAKCPAREPHRGTVTTGEVKLRIVPAAGAKRLVTAGSGEFELEAGVRLVVGGKAELKFPSGVETYVMKLPDGFGTWAFAWDPGQSVLWMVEGTRVRRIDFADPNKVKEEAMEDASRLPESLRDPVSAALKKKRRNVLP